MSAKFDDFPSLPFQDIKEKPKRHGWMDGCTDGKTDGRENSIPPRKHSLRGGIKKFLPRAESISSIGKSGRKKHSSGSSLVLSNSDPRNRFFYLHLTSMTDSYSFAIQK